MVMQQVKSVWRFLMKDRLTSMLNVAGLALGICSSIFLLLWVQDERQMDHFHKQSDRLFQVYSRNTYEGKSEAGFATQGLLADELKRKFPEIEMASGFEYIAAPGTGSNLEVKGKTGKMVGFFAGNDFLSMFSYPLLLGNKTFTLAAPDGIAISRRMATYFFGSPEEAIGQTIRLEAEEDLEVTAVFEDIPANSSQQFDFLRAWKPFIAKNKWASTWGSASPATFILLKKGADLYLLESKIQDFLYQYISRENGIEHELGLLTYTDKYLYSVFKNGYPSGGRIAYVRLFTILAIVILLIACINFMNLATANAVKRAKGIGLLKTIGASRVSLAFRCLLEAGILTGISIGMSLILLFAFMPLFAGLTGKELSIPIYSFKFWLKLACIWFLVGLVAGSYPAFYLSSLTPLSALREKVGKNGALLRKGLVVVQFCVSAVLIVTVMVFQRQMDYIQQSNLGYDRNNLVYIPIEGNVKAHYMRFKTAVASVPGVVSVTKMRNSPTYIEHHTTGVSWPGKSEETTLSFTDAIVGYDFIKTMRLQLEEGRDFSAVFGTDTAAFLINETAVKAMGLKQPIGQMLNWNGREGHVIGVLKDFHFNSMHQVIEPLIIRLDDDWGWGTVLIRLAPQKIEKALQGLKTIHQRMNPAVPFTYQFSDWEFSKLYQSEQTVSRIATCFAVLATFISCLGLFGLTVFSVTSRVKEIGVRKVLGASVANVAYLLSVGFLKLVFLALLLAIPIGWWIMSIWLNNFAYHINLSWWMFVSAGALAIFIALITISFQAVKAALDSPIESLRSE